MVGSIFFTGFKAIVAIAIIVLLAALVYFVARKPVNPEQPPSTPPVPIVEDGSSPASGGVRVDARGVDVNVPVNVKYSVQEWYYPGEGMRVERVNLGTVGVRTDRQTIADRLGSPVYFESSNPPTSISSDWLALGTRFGEIEQEVGQLRQEVGQIQQEVEQIHAGQQQILRRLGISPEPESEPEPEPEPETEPGVSPPSE